jgi:hypothetical protein
VPHLRTRLWPWAVSALTAAVAMTASIGWRRADRSDPRHPLMRVDIELGPEANLARITDGPLLALSPDGTLLAFDSCAIQPVRPDWPYAGSTRVRLRRSPAPRAQPRQECLDSPFSRFSGAQGIARRAKMSAGSW